MIVEHAILTLRPGTSADFLAAFAEAATVMATQPGVRSLRLGRCVERSATFLLLVEWNTVADHTEGFRASPDYDRWKRLLHHFYEPFPFVEHFEYTEVGFDVA